MVSRCRYGLAMDQPARRSFALDLHGTDLTDHAGLTRLVAAHTIAPARAWWGLPAPQPGEGRNYLVERVEHSPSGLEVHHMRSYGLDESPRSFDPLIRALLLFARLFPQCVGFAGSVEETLRHPGMAVLADSHHLIGRPYEAIADLCAGLLGVPSPTPSSPGDYHAKARNDEALAELGEARQLINQALAPIDDDDHVQFVDIGLPRLGFASASRMDDTLRRDVRRRLVWFTTFEVFEPDDWTSTTEWFERGVFPADVPETIAGLAALDYSEQLGYGRALTTCSQCGLLMTVDGRQRFLASRGRPVYHPGCYLEHKRTYWRDYQRGRARRRRGEPPSSQPD
jgi:hypothetical protein